jgi:hypothetical protein
VNQAIEDDKQDQRGNDEKTRDQGNGRPRPHAVTDAPLCSIQAIAPPVARR